MLRCTLETVARSPTARHGFVTLVAVPRDVAYATIYKNQT